MIKEGDKINLRWKAAAIIKTFKLFRKIWFNYGKKKVLCEQPYYVNKAEHVSLSAFEQGLVGR